MTAQNWSFSPAVITAKKGEMLEVELTGVSGTHGFSIPALGVNVPIAPGERKTVTIPTENAGTFELRCSIPCGEGHLDMKGTVVIGE